MCEVKNYGIIQIMTFKYNKLNAKCMWCKRADNPHPDYTNETIPTKLFISEKGRKIELCFSCFEDETDKTQNIDVQFKKKLDLKFEMMKLLKL